MKTGEWYYQWMGEVVGPVSARKLKQYAGEGHIEHDTLIRQGNDGTWVLADKVRGLLDTQPSARPATAAPPPPVKTTNAEPIASKQTDFGGLADIRLRRATVARIREEAVSSDPFPLMHLLGCVGGILVIVILVVHTVNDSPSHYATPPTPDVSPTEAAIASHPGTPEQLGAELRRIQGDNQRVLDILLIPHLLDPPSSGGDGFVAPGSEVITETFRQEVNDRIVKAGYSREEADTFTKALNAQGLKTDIRRHLNPERSAEVDRVLDIISRTPNLLDPPSRGEVQFVSPGSSVMTEEYRQEVSERIVRAGFSREEANAFTSTLNDVSREEESRRR